VSGKGEGGRISKGRVRPRVDLVKAKLRPKWLTCEAQFREVPGPAQAPFSARCTTMAQ
jgi:hypothetical protein